MEILGQIIIALVTTTLGSVLSYLAAIRKSKDEIKAVEVKAETEIKKIESEYQKQIEKMRVETEEQIKLKIAESELASKKEEEKLKNDLTAKFLDEFMKNPVSGMNKLKDIEKLANIFKTNGQN